MSDTQISDDDVMCAAGTEPCPCAVAALERAAELESALADLRIKMAGSSREYESLLAEAKDEIAYLKTIFRTNTLRLKPDISHAEIDVAIDAARKP